MSSCGIVDSDEGRYEGSRHSSIAGSTTRSSARLPAVVVPPVMATDVMHGRTATGEDAGIVGPGAMWC